MKWRTKGVVFLCSSCFLFFCILGCLIALSIIGDFNGSTPIFTGSCDVAQNVNIGVHAAISFVSLLVMMSSDFFMRLVLAPHKQDIEKAHIEARWMDIGINSWKNLGIISLPRQSLWFLGVLSSIPLQLLFNASVFSTATSTDYDQILVSKGFLEGEAFALPGVALLEGAGRQDDVDVLEPKFRAFQGNASGFYWTRLDSLECQQTYLATQNGLQFYRNLVIVIETSPDPNITGWTDDEVWSGTLPPFFNNSSTDDYFPNATNSLWSYSTHCSVGNNLGDTFNVCSGDFGYYALDSDTSWDFSEPWQYQWLQSQYGLPPPIEYFPKFNLAYNNISALFCLAEPHISPCKVEVTNLLLLAVCICVLLKCFFAAASLILMWKERPIQCLGDAIQFSLEQKGDQATAGLCTYSQADFRNQSRKRTFNDSADTQRRWSGQARPLAIGKKRWGSAVPKTAWLVTYVPISLVLIAMVCLLVIAINETTYANRGPFYEAGFGANANNKKIDAVPGSRFGRSITANLPQLAITACYFGFSSFYSALFQAQDWAEFTKNPQRLKVTVPEDDQESSYLLQIPWKWGTLFTAISIALHWLASQSLFVAATEVLPSDSGDDLAEPLGFKVAFSTQALLATLVLTFVALLVPLVLSLRELPENSIIVGTNSAAISASCQRRWQGTNAEDDIPELQPSDDDSTQRIWLQKLKWGILSEGTTDTARPGHLGIALEKNVIGEPKRGDFYA